MEASDSTETSRIEDERQPCGLGAPDASPADPEALAQMLDGVPGYRVLRELKPRTHFDGHPYGLVLHGVIADVETTGLHPDSAEVIGLTLLPFTYTPEGEVLATGTPFQALRQPSYAIPPAVTRLTGITDADVHGLTISADAVDEFLGLDTLVIAHDAAFDRPFAETLCPRFAKLPWCCSLTQAPWDQEGFRSGRLSDLAQHHGYYVRRHRAVDDCRALLEILSRPLPLTKTTALGAILQASRRPTFRIWARGARFSERDDLRASGYRWNSGDDGRPRAWWKEIGSDELESEIGYLTELFFSGLIDPLVEEIDAQIRFSTRR